MLTKASGELAARLLAWDRARVAALAAKGFDVSAYQARQQAAEAALGQDPAAWPQVVRDLFMCVIEVNRAQRVPAMQVGIGRLATPPLALNAAGIRTLKALAAEVGVIDRLREVAPARWTEEEAPR